MKVNAVTAVEPYKIEVREKEIAKPVSENWILVKNEYSLISPGTELAVIAGAESWAPLPFTPGYAAVGTILEVGKDVSSFKTGDKIYYQGKHQSMEYIVPDGEALILKVPEELPIQWIPFTKLASIAITSLRASSAELGDFVVVTGLGLIGNLTGLGLIGNFAAQFFKTAGCYVIGVDLIPERLALAQKCGIPCLLNPSQDNITEKVIEITEGEGATAVVEATGIPSLVEECIKYAARGGEVILLGSPRGEFKGDAMNILQEVHLWSGKAKGVTLTGAHEYRYPIYKIPFVKHSFERNSSQIFRFMLSKQLVIEELITHVVKPQEAPIIYQALKERQKGYFGILFEWC